MKVLAGNRAMSRLVPTARSFYGARHFSGQRAIHVIGLRSSIFSSYLSTSSSKLIKTGSTRSFRSQSTAYSSLSSDIQPDNLSIDEYHKVADHSLELIVAEYESLGDLIPQIDVELSQGVLTLELPPHGTYVINKQPPNKQIWLASPVSGPKRYDLVDGKWTYLRDMSTLGELLRNETESVTKERGIESVEFEGLA